MEIWKDIPGYNGQYKVSNLGRVKSLKGKVENILKPYLNKDGYGVLGLFSMPMVQKKHYIHRVVAESFIPNAHNKKEVNHKSGDKMDNRVVNLEWVTKAENLKHAHRTGLINIKGEGHGRSKLTKQNIAEIRSRLKNGSTQSSLAKEFGVKQPLISKIKLGILWSHT